MANELTAAAAASAAPERFRRAAFEAGGVAVAAATVFALALVLLRATGAAQTTGVTVCALLLAVLVVAAREPAATYALVRRTPAAAVAAGLLLGAGLAAIGPNARLLFLPALLLLGTLAAASDWRPTLAACACASAGLLAVPPLHVGATSGDDRQLLLVCAAALVALPVALALVVERVARSLSVPVTPPAAAASAPTVAAPPVASPVGAPTAGPSAAAAPADDRGTLTPRQREAVALVTTGMRHGEVAEQLGVSVHQVRRLLRQARERTGSGTTRELIASTMTERRPPPAGD